MMKKNTNYWTRLLRSVRQEWSRHNPDRKACFIRAKLNVEVLPTFHRDKWKCNHCNELFALSEVQCDHINPVSNTIPSSYEEFVDSFKRLHSNELQILCKGCHNVKTKQDNFNKKYKEAVYSVANYLNMSDEGVMRSLTQWKIIHKFDVLIRKIKESYEPRKIDKCEKELDLLKKKYL